MVSGWLANGLPVCKSPSPGWDINTTAAQRRLTWTGHLTCSNHRAVSRWSILRRDLGWPSLSETRSLVSDVLGPASGSTPLASHGCRLANAKAKHQAKLHLVDSVAGPLDKAAMLLGQISPVRRMSSDRCFIAGLRSTAWRHGRPAHTRWPR